MAYWLLGCNPQGSRGWSPLASPECMLEAGAAKRSHAEGMDSWLLLRMRQAVGAGIDVGLMGEKMYECDELWGWEVRDLLCIG